MEIIEVGDQYYISAKSALADDRTRVLKHNDTFAIFDRYGDIQPVGLGEQGIYDHGTRFLSRLTLQIAGERPMLLSSTIREDNALLAVDLSNPDMLEESLPRGALHLYRSKFLWDSVCYEKLRVHNYSLCAVESWLTLLFDSDFADIFEVRGQRRERRGQRLADVSEGPTGASSSVFLSYRGLDEVVRRMRIHCEPAAKVTPGAMQLPFHLEPHEAWSSWSLSRVKPTPSLNPKNSLPTTARLGRRGLCCGIETQKGARSIRPTNSSIAGSAGLMPTFR